VKHDPFVNPENELNLDLNSQINLKDFKQSQGKKQKQFKKPIKLELDLSAF